MPVPSTYLRATLSFRNVTTGSRAHVALWYLPSSLGATPPSLATVTTYANAFNTAYATAVAAALTTAHQLTSVTLKWVTGGAEVEGDNNNGPVAGTVSGDTLPEVNTMVIQRRTGLVGRMKRGRIFFPYVPESFQDEGDLSGSGITAAAALAGMVKSDVVASGVTYKPQHFDHKNNVLVPVVQAGYLNQVTTRRDRRSPKQYTPVRV